MKLLRLTLAAAALAALAAACDGSAPTAPAPVHTVGALPVADKQPGDPVTQDAPPPPLPTLPPDTTNRGGQTVGSGG